MRKPHRGTHAEIRKLNLPPEAFQYLSDTIKACLGFATLVQPHESKNMCKKNALLCLLLTACEVVLVQLQPLLPLRQPAIEIPHEAGNAPACPPSEQVQSLNSNQTEELLRLVQAYLSPSKSCAEVAQLPKFTAGLYWINDGNGSASQVYCSSGGEMRLGFLNMSDPSEKCPSPWEEIIVPGAVRSCVRSFTGSGCESVYYSTNGREYNTVCGKIIGYQYGNVGAFHKYYRDNSLTIDDAYFDGIVLTVGAPGSRQHIWSWVASLSEIYNGASDNCICTNVGSPSPATSPPWVGNDFFCESGTSGLWGGQFYANDPLWDGDGCGPGSSCCTFPGEFIQPALGNIPPNFCKQLPFTTSEDLEVRFCRALGGSNYNGTPVKNIELFVKLQ